MGGDAWPLLEFLDNEQAAEVPGTALAQPAPGQSRQKETRRPQDHFFRWLEHDAYRFAPSIGQRWYSFRRGPCGAADVRRQTYSQSQKYRVARLGPAEGVLPGVDQRGQRQPRAVLAAHPHHRGAATAAPGAALGRPQA